MGYIKPAAVIAAHLERQGKTPGWLSDASGVPLEQVTGESDITMTNALSVTRVLGVTLAELAGEENALTVVELAAELKITPDTVYRKAGAGEIPGFKVGGSWRFYLSEVVAAGRKAKDDIWSQPARARARRVA